MSEKTLEVLEAVREASISLACLLDDTFTDTDRVVKSIEHVQDQLAIIDTMVRALGMGIKYKKHIDIGETDVRI